MTGFNYLSQPIRNNTPPVGSSIYALVNAMRFYCLSNTPEPGTERWHDLVDRSMDGAADFDGALFLDLAASRLGLQLEDIPVAYNEEMDTCPVWSMLLDKLPALTAISTTDIGPERRMYVLLTRTVGHRRSDPMLNIIEVIGLEGDLGPAVTTLSVEELARLNPQWAIGVRLGYRWRIRRTLIRRIKGFFGRY